MRKKLLSAAIITAVSASLFTANVIADSNLKHYKEDFESYSVGENYNGYNGWTTWTEIKEGTVKPEKNYTAVENDPSADGAGNLAGALTDMDTGNSAITANTFSRIDVNKMDGSAANGIVTVQFKWLQSEQSKNSRITLKDGDKQIVGMWVNAGCNCGLSISAPTDKVGGKINYSWDAPNLCWGSDNGGGQSYVTKNTWNTVKFELNFNTQKVKTYWNGNLKNYTLYFSTEGITGLDNITLASAADSNAKIYMDDIYIVEGTDLSIADVVVPKEYNISNSIYEIKNNGIELKANITKGDGDAILYAAIYDQSEHLIGADIFPINSETTTNNHGVFTYNKTMNNMTNAYAAKILIWDENMKPCCDAKPCEKYIAPTPEPTPEPTPSPTPTPTPAPTDDPNDISDVDAVPYIKADIPRPNVVQYVTEDQIEQIPPEADVYRTYPNGKMKAFLMSFDDGPGASDVDILMPLFKQYNLTSAFNICLHEDANTFKGLIHVDNDTKTGEWIGNFQEQVVKRYTGYEIGNHGAFHYPDYMLNKDNYRTETGLNKYNIETAFGQECASYIRAYKDHTPDANPASGKWRDAYLKYIGCRYMRNAPAKNVSWANKPQTLNYNVPVNFFDWNPTIHMTTSPMLKDTDANYYTADIIEYFANELNAGREWKLLFGWGHGSDISSISWGPYTITPNGAYPAFVDACAAANKYADVLWNVTPIEYVDYVNASRLTQVTVSGDSISIYNPSPSVDVWMNVKGENVLIPAGQTIEK